ncbi:MAG: helix-turn-helix transcriptional regulator [Candidatus Eremiobacteraeota bacterium]|nr:helix-turn-helix transcriptional regulator [Candidatus Eremiobacteraeota bacterium]
MDRPDRPIVVVRPGALADGVVGLSSAREPFDVPKVIVGGTLLVYVVHGVGWFRSAHVEGPIGPRTLVCVPAGPFDCEVSDDREAVVVTLNEPPGDADEKTGFTFPFMRRLDPDEGARWHARLLGVLASTAARTLRAPDVRALKHDLARLIWLKRAPYVQETLADVFDTLWRRHAEPLSLSALAQTVGYSPNYLNDLARAHTGRPLGRWIADIRMARARHDLEHTDIPVAAVGSASGYDDPAYFSRAFRRLHGVPPATWRLAKQEGAGLTVPFDELKETHHIPDAAPLYAAAALR